MDYYEELGVERSASVAEIRQAYRRLMQLLHPDHSTDEAGRRLAELQARRLNAVLAVLTDPVGRERYDLQLSFPPAAPSVLGSPPKRRGPALFWLWPLAGITLILVVFCVRVPQPRRTATLANAQPPSPTVQASNDPAHREPRPHSRAARRSSRIPNSIPRSAKTVAPRAMDNPAPLPPPLALEAPPVSIQAEESLEPLPLGGPPREPHDLPPRSNLAGDWLLVAGPAIESKGFYPPEYIELRLTDHLGVLTGKYRARYRIPDRAISPNVSFEFEGPAIEIPGADGTRLPWTSPDGSRGEVTLRLLNSGNLEVNWVVRSLGNELGLISGTATLVRKID